MSVDARGSPRKRQEKRYKPDKISRDAVNKPSYYAISTRSELLSSSIVSPILADLPDLNPDRFLFKYDQKSAS